MKTVIIKYNAGNIQSVMFALHRIGCEAIISDDVNEITTADKVIFPGVGEASTAMNYLKEKNLHTLIKNLKQPVLGICLGMQLMCAHSEEGNTACLGIFDETVRLFDAHPTMKVPHVGWNVIQQLKSSLFNGINESAYTYFVHSYYVPLSKYAAAVTPYITSFSSSLEKDNFYGVQFHPEKSGLAGETILTNFLKL
jgi:glutamine amidotransferase